MTTTTEPITATPPAVGVPALHGRHPAAPVGMAALAEQYGGHLIVLAGLGAYRDCVPHGGDDADRAAMARVADQAVLNTYAPLKRYYELTAPDGSSIHAEDLAAWIARTTPAPAPVVAPAAAAA